MNCCSAGVRIGVAIGNKAGVNGLGIQKARASLLISFGDAHVSDGSKCSNIARQLHGLILGPVDHVTGVSCLTNVTEREGVEQVLRRLDAC